MNAENRRQRDALVVMFKNYEYYWYLIIFFIND